MVDTTQRQRILILGAAGRDFHNFNVVFRNDPAVAVVAFTATQIAGIAGRTYPPMLAGPLYPQGIPIVAEDELDTLCRTQRIDQVVFAYSDAPHATVMHLASRALAAGADFRLLGPQHTQLASTKPVIAVSAVRTGCGKSQTTRFLAGLLRARGLTPAVVRHPMPYGDLARQAVQRFASVADLQAAQCTVEEREEYEPHLAAGCLVFAGVDYERILRAAEAEADLVLWDGGNNDFPFFRPDLHIVLVDPLRAGDEENYHPGEAVLRMADIAVIAKTDVAPPEAVTQCRASVARLNPAATVVAAASPVRLDGAIAGKRVLVIEDGPTTTHGGMPGGAGLHAARQAGAIPVDPRPWAAPAIAEVFRRYPHLGPVLPAMGYSPAQLDALRTTIAAVPADAVLVATPVDLGALIAIKQPVVRARYDFASTGSPSLEELVGAFLDRRMKAFTAER